MDTKAQNLLTVFFTCHRNYFSLDNNSNRFMSQQHFKRLPPGEHLPRHQSCLILLLHDSTASLANLSEKSHAGTRTGLSPGKPVFNPSSCSRQMASLFSNGRHCFSFGSPSPKLTSPGFGLKDLLCAAFAPPKILGFNATLVALNSGSWLSLVLSGRTGSILGCCGEDGRSSGWGECLQARGPRSGTLLPHCEVEEGLGVCGEDGRSSG